MSRADLSDMTCQVARAIEIVGDPWTLMILREMFLGSRRFDQLQRQTGASPHILSLRLKRLEDEGIVRREIYSAHPPRHCYKLTDKGIDLWPVIVALKSWGERWLEMEGKAPITLTHEACGYKTDPHLVCSACDQPIDPRSVSVSMSQPMVEERKAVAGSRRRR